MATSSNTVTTTPTKTAAAVLFPEIQDEREEDAGVAVAVVVAEAEEFVGRAGAFVPLAVELAQVWEMFSMSACLTSAPMLIVRFCRHLGHRSDGRPFMYPVLLQLLNQHRGSWKLGKDRDTKSAPGYEDQGRLQAHIGRDWLAWSAQNVS